MYTYQALVLAVVDGDTLKLELDLGLHVRSRLSCRLLGIDAPELRTPDGKAARRFVDEWLEAHCPIDDDTQRAIVVVRTHKDRTEKYGRYLAQVFSDAMLWRSGEFTALASAERDTGRTAVTDSFCLNDDLVAAGLAVPYDGGPRS